MKTEIIKIEGNIIHVVVDNDIKEYILEEWVKPGFVKLGPAEIDIKNGKVAFVSMDSSSPSATGNASAPKQTESKEKFDGKWKKLIDAWVPKENGDQIEGKLLRKRSDIGKNKSMMYDLETKESIRGVWGGTVLDSKLEMFREGDYVKIVFLGKKDGSDAEYKDYDVFKGVE